MKRLLFILAFLIPVGYVSAYKEFKFGDEVVEGEYLSNVRISCIAPASEKEFNRIKKVGGKLINYRINGKLNITRAIGDLSYKNRNNGCIYEQDVLAIPEVTKYSLDDVDFIVMGSDGFWDYGDDVQTICDNIYNEIKKNQKRDLCDLIGNIFDKGLAKANNYLRGTYNMSCIIIQFVK